MRKKIVNQTNGRIWGASVVAFVLCGVLFWQNALIDDIPAHAVHLTIGVPVRITIKSIAVDAPIEKVELTSDGSMDVPKRPMDTGWYALGKRPGETGSAVIAGHFDWLYDAPAVFKDLDKVKPGDTIVVEDDAGATITFIVREHRTYEAAADATDVFSSTDGKAHLNLVTCGGVWDKRLKQYSKRLVVFADRQ